MGGRADDAAAQAERAIGAWELVVLDAPEDRVLEVLRRVARFKRFEFEALRAKLPGPVRRGARVDLEALEAELRAAGLRCELRRRPGTEKR